MVAKNSSQHFLQRCLDVLRQVRFRVDALQQIRIAAMHEGLKLGLRIDDSAAVDFVEVAVVRGIQRQRHLRDRHRRILLLLHQFGDSLTALELLARGFVQVRRELREGGELAELRERQPNSAAELLDDIGLRGAADARHRDSRVDGRAHSSVEKVRFQEYLAVRDRDDVGRDEGGNVARLCFDDRQSGQRTGLAFDAAIRRLFDEFLVDARGAFEQAGMQ